MPCAGQTSDSFSGFHFYSGNLHAHTTYTSSHGAQYEKLPGYDRYMTIDSMGVSNSVHTRLKKNWKEFQAAPSKHFKIAKANNYDFYVVTDHSQEKAFNPPSKLNSAWVKTGKAAKKITDLSFVGLRGYEYSENNGPEGKGHFNVINSASYLNALQKGNDLQIFYTWLKNAKSAGVGPVVASFNHPGKNQFNDWAYRDPAITNIITLLEVINSNDKIHYDGFVRALDKGWKVSPVAGNDNHNITGITNQFSRTFVLAKNKTKKELLTAMRMRRTYASLDTNIHCIYWVNQEVMGSTIQKNEIYNFNICLKDPDIKGNDITKVDIIKDKGVIVATYTCETPNHSVNWKVSISDSKAHYFFIRVWNEKGGDVPKPEPGNPIAWLAPVWIQD